QALSDVTPLRDLFGMLFFVSVGMLLDPKLVWQHFGTLALVIAVVAAGKGLILAGVVRAFRYRNVVPLAVALTLFQVGEFAFVLARVGRGIGAISNDLYTLLLNTAVATMALTPIVSGLTLYLYGRFGARRVADELEAINIPQSGLSDHIVIAGGGRVGRSIADALSHMRLPCVLIELDDRRVRQARAAGLPLIYGDAGQSVVLEAANIRQARAVLVTVPAFPDVGRIVRAVRRLRREMPIGARADGAEAIRALYELGIQEVTSPEFEAGIEMTRQALTYFNVPAHEILHVASAIRRERYSLPGNDAQSTSPVGEVLRQLDFTWFRLSPDSAFNGRTIGEL